MVMLKKCKTLKCQNKLYKLQWKKQGRLHLYVFYTTKCKDEVEQNIKWWAWKTGRQWTETIRHGGKLCWKQKSATDSSMWEKVWNTSKPTAAGHYFTTISDICSWVPYITLNLVELKLHFSLLPFFLKTNVYNITHLPVCMPLPYL